MGFQPDVIHCHDWHAGMMPVLLTQYRNQEFFSQDQNGLYHPQPPVPRGVSQEYPGGSPGAGLGALSTSMGWNSRPGELHERWPELCQHALTTVSPTYAQEIQIPFTVANLEGSAGQAQSFLSGILNGIDRRGMESPDRSAYLKKLHLALPKRKAENKQPSRQSLGLRQMTSNIPMIGMVTRLARQKGLDLVAHVLEEMLELDLQIVVLGTGEAQFEELFQALCREVSREGERQH
jgi:starch synthase